MPIAPVPPIARANRWRQRTALVADGNPYDYASLLHASAILAGRLRAAGLEEDGARVAYLLPPGSEHVALLWGVWRVGAIAVPLSASQAPAEWEYIIGDTGAAVVVGDGVQSPLSSLAARLGARYLPVEAGRWAQGGSDAAETLPRSGAPAERDSPRLGAGLNDAPDVAALILYTSGTTSRPKGVVLTHRNLAAQMSTLVEAWGWREADRVLHVLPLNHVHGLVNVLGCALWAGACCEFLAPFEPVRAWERFASGEITVFMAVPTIYARLLAAYDTGDGASRSRWSAGARGMRLMVSGSAALPVGILERWRAVTGHVLLERYGMTEIGMALSNPLAGARRPGAVGVPLPGVNVRLVDESGREVADGTPGEIEVKGPGVFREYWQQPDATRSAFRDGWFRTGDVAVVEQGAYRILGRQSIDIIKTGGYKVSALEIEEVIREHPSIAECAVVGLPDDEWGERVGVVLVPRGGARGPTLDELRAWAASRLAKYKLPTRLVSVSALPRNAMGKVVKARVKEAFGPELRAPGVE